jgi:aminopeptidase N
MKKNLSVLFVFISIQTLSAQNFTRKDSLHGGLRFERTCFDVLRYDLNITINPDEKSIVGFNDIAFKIVESTSRIQLDLFENMKIDSILYNNQKLEYVREFNAVFVQFSNRLSQNSTQALRFYYSGKPKIAKRAPWDGGFVFTKDRNKNHFVGVAVQGTGASLWYPVKDTQTDEPDNGATIKVAVPNGLMNVSNGRFIGSLDMKNGYTRWDWEVKNPINTYNITVNIADYVHIHEHHKGLDLDYYVLRENEAIARKHFEEVKPMMNCFQNKFGEYPFKNDGFKLVETSYLGMEHQSAVAYGNKYLKGYLGNDLSGTGIGLLFDYITIHESGHEWFGNSITSADIADMWIHEGFTQYTEIVFVECQFGYEKAMSYANGLRKNVQNDRPIIGQCCVNNEGGGDMYPKGALLLNTLRHVLNDDEKWWAMLFKYSETFRHKIIDTPTVVAFFNAESGMNLTPIFNQYLNYTSIPKLEVRKKGSKISYRWVASEPNFEMPIDITIKGVETRLTPTQHWQQLPQKIKNWEDLSIKNNEVFIEVAKVQSF